MSTVMSTVWLLPRYGLWLACMLLGGGVLLAMVPLLVVTEPFLALVSAAVTDLANVVTVVTGATLATAANLVPHTSAARTSLTLFGQLGLTVLLGYLGRKVLAPLPTGTLVVAQVRRQLNRLVLWVTLPVLVFDTVHRAPLGLDVLQVPLVAGMGMAGTAVLAWMLLVRCYGRTPEAGGLVLAASAGSVSFLGIPIIRALFGPEEARIAVYFAVLNVPLSLLAAACIRSGLDHPAQTSSSAPPMGGTRALLPSWTPKAAWTVLLTLSRVARQAARQFFSLPATWALLAAVAFHEVPLPPFVEPVLQVIGLSVAPTVMLALGMGLQFDRALAPYRMALPAVAIKLAISPLVVLACGLLLGLSGTTLVIVALQGAMPTQVLGVVIAERYGLNARLVGLTLALNTALAFVLLPVVVATVQTGVTG
ncbi:MAG TPA: AEC family transporter [Chloroflexota bacterium]|nr:AEC family transporter [Chloroflexota bacterium]